jgi:putative ABC transport system permease protein
MSASGRRPIVRWAWRLFKRDWRQQTLVIGLLTFAVAVVLFSTVAVSNAVPSGDGEFGDAAAVVTFEADSVEQIAADIAALRESNGAVEAIGHRPVKVQGAVETLDFRAQEPGGPLGAPMLALRRGRYPASATEIALTDGAAELLRTGLGQEFVFDRARRRVVGIVQNPADFDDEFALASPTGFVPQFVAVLTERDFARGGTGSGILRTGTRHSIEGRGDNGRALAAALSLLVSVVLMLLIALVAAAAFAAVAQRRLRQLGMLTAVGATERHLRLVMVATGVLVGGVAAAGGVVIAAAAWIVSRSSFEEIVGHSVSIIGAQWWVVASCVALAVLTSTAAAWWPARAASRVPVVAALSERPPHPSSARRSLLIPIILLAGGVASVSVSVDFDTGSANPWTLIGGALAIVTGVLLMSPLAIRAAAAAGRRAPIAVRLALRDLSRYQSRSGAALAAITLSLGIAVSVMVVAAAAADGASEGNLSPNQLLIRTGKDFIAPEQLPQMRAAVETFAAGVDGTSLYALDAVIGHDRVAAEQGGDVLPPLVLARRINSDTSRFVTPLYFATPELLARAGLTDDATVDAFTVHTGNLLFEPVAARDTPSPDCAAHPSRPRTLRLLAPAGWLVPRSKPSVHSPGDRGST